MTSKNLFFKLMKEDLKRRMWAVALLSLGFFFFYPVVAAFTAGEIRNALDYAKGLAEYEDGLARWLSFNCGMTVFLMMLSALICGLSSFSFLNSKSKVDFYHGIPVRREKLFAANFLDGILILAVPYGICQMLAVLVGISNGANGSRLWSVALAAYGLHITYYILMYSTVVVAAMMTGHLVVGFLGTAVFASYAPMATGLLVGYLSSFFRTYSANQPGLLSEHVLMYGIRFSPLTEYIYQLEQYGDRYQSSVSMAVPVLIAWIASLLLAALSCFLYRKRPSEAAGKAMAFPITCPVIRILLTIVSALGLGIFFYAVRSSMGWVVFGILCGGGICHCVVEIIYHFDFRKLFAHKGQLVCCLLVALGIFAVFKYDLLGYDRYLPKAGQVRQASVRVNTMTNWVSYGHAEQYPDGHYQWTYDSGEELAIQNMKYQNIENLLTIASEGIEQVEMMKLREKHPWDWEYYVDDSGEDRIWSQVTICYTLNSGRKVCRTYHMPINGKLLPAMERLYGDEEFQKGTFPILNMTSDQVASVRIRGKYSREEQNKEEVRLGSLSGEEKARILGTYQKEFAAMTLKRMEGEAPMALIRFCQETDEEALEWWKRQEANGYKDYPQYRYRGWRDLTNKMFYPIYPSFTETIRLLQEQGVELGGYLEDLDVRGIRVWVPEKSQEDDLTYLGEAAQEFYEDRYDSDGGYFYIRNPERIQELRKILVYDDLCYYDPFFQTENVDVNLLIWDLEVDVDKGYDYEEYEDGNWNAGVRVFFPKGQVPDFFWRELEK